jgi:2-amino-4-hydroxy-6-hydroxymethyldihydropteridine diphosphokinase
MNVVGIGVGSNINPKENIQNAIKLIEERFGEVQSSKMIETEPVGFKDQDNFMNGAFLIRTEKMIDEVKVILKEIENELGRIRTENKFGPRTIDLDVVVFNSEIVDKDFYTRDFVKKPILELIPDLKY